MQSQFTHPKVSKGPAPLFVRFWRYVDKAGECWEWTGAKTPVGRGHIGEAGKTLIAARVAYEIASGQPIPPEHKICHTCDNPGCVRNDEPGFHEVNGVLLPRWGHLFLGTTTQNNLDKIAKGRSGVPVGERHYRTKHDGKVVSEIVGFYRRGLALQRELGRIYGLNRATISRLVSGERRASLRA